MFQLITALLRTGRGQVISLVLENEDMRNGIMNHISNQPPLVIRALLNALTKHVILNSKFARFKKHILMTGIFLVAVHYILIIPILIQSLSDCISSLSCRYKCRQICSPIPHAISLLHKERPLLRNSQVFQPLFPPKFSSTHLVKKPFIFATNH